MPTFRTIRLFLLPLLAGVLLLGAFAASAASAASSSYGELLRFNGKGVNGSGKKFELEEETHAFGVDPKDNSIYVGDEKTAESEGVYRIQKYNEAGDWEGEVTVRPKLPKTGIEYAEDLDGIAVDSEKGRVYVLVSYGRENADTVDPGKEVAGAVYAYSTTPVGGKLEPASGTEAGTGLLGTLETLKSNSETQGEALLEPSGITVDPATHEVLILGQVDQGTTTSPQLHLALARLSETGTLGTPYVDPATLQLDERPDSPVVSAAGTVFFESATTETGGGELLQIPAGFNSSAEPKLLFHFEEPESLIQGPFKGELAEFAENSDESSFGGGLALVSEGTGEGRIIADAEVHEVEAGGTLGTLNTAALVFHYSESGGEAKVSEKGFVGGKAGELGTAGSCVIGFAGNYPQVAGATGEKLFVLAPSTGEVIEFGPQTTSKCPQAKAGSVEALVNGIKVSELNTSKPFTLAAKVTGASVLSTEWKFSGSETANQPVVTTAGEQTQTAELEHQFTNSGAVKIEAIIHTDDLASPELTAKVTLNVSGASGSPKITKNPTSKAVVEGESATFEAAASGEPTPTVQWEESSNGVFPGTVIPGATSTKLTISSTTPAESGREYRAVFTNTAGKAETSAATLTVEAPAAPEVTRQPSNTSVEEGQSATFEAGASGKPSPTVQWEESQNGGASFTAISGATSTKLTISSTTTAESGREYRAVFSNPSLPAGIASSAATLTVTAKSSGGGGGGGGSSEGGGGGSTTTTTTTTTTTSGGGGGGGVQGFKESSPRAVLASSSLPVSSSGAVTVKVSCPAGVSTCSGTVTLKTVGAVSARVSPAASQAKASVLTLASGSFSVAGGHVKTITLHLSAKARKLLAHSHSLRAKATVLAHDPAGGASTVLATVTLKAASHH